MKIKTLTIENGIVMDKAILGIPVVQHVIASLGKKRNVRSLSALDWPIGLTLHDTSYSDDAWVCAEALAALEASDGRALGVHFLVDAARIVQVLPLDEISWHAGDGGEGDHATISIALCAPAADPAVEAAAMALAAALMETFALTALFPHTAWQATHCPAALLDRANGWRDFCDGVRQVQASGLLPETAAALAWAEAHGICRPAVAPSEQMLSQADCLVYLYRACVEQV